MGNLSDLIGAVKRQPDLPPEDQLESKIIAEGFDPPPHIDADGRIHRFNTGYKSGDRSGWYVLFPSIGDGPACGAFGDWRMGVERKFVSDIGRELSFVEKMQQQDLQKQVVEARRKEEETRKSATTEACQEIWSSATDASPNHPYLEKKGIGPHGAKVTGDGRLVLPLYNPEGEVQALQYISREGEKRFHGPVGGCMHMIGPQDAKIACIAEGFADACTIVEETGFACYIAYSGSNMAKIAPTIKSMGAHKQIMVVSDRDEHGKGQEFAKKATDLINGTMILPPVTGDINDYRAGGGDVASLITPRKNESWLVSGADFCKKPDPIKWLIKGWIQQNALCMIHGPSGSGKTFLALDMILSIATGKQWKGRRTKQAKVIYLAGEGQHGLKGRLAGWSQYHDQPIENLWVSKTGCDFNTPEGYMQVADSIRSLNEKPDVIVIDTLHRFLNGDENSAVDTKTMLDACAAIMEQFGCTVILVHHTGVSEQAQERARGSSAWRGALDIEINVKGGDKEKAEPMTVKQVKSKDAEMEMPVAFELKQTPIEGWVDDDGDQVHTAVLITSNKAPSVAPATKPMAHKTPEQSKLERNKKRLERAWVGGNQSMEEGQAYVTREELLQYLISEEGKTEATAKKELQPSSSGRLLFELINNHIIEKHGELLIIRDPELMSIFRILKRG